MPVADDDWSAGFAAPVFNPDDARVALGRALRDLKLNERGPRFELRGKVVAELSMDNAALKLRLARRLALTPEWDTRLIASASQQREALAEVKKRLARWETED
jgi:hypothetical protein